MSPKTKDNGLSLEGYVLIALIIIGIVLVPIGIISEYHVLIVIGIILIASVFIGTSIHAQHGGHRKITGKDIQQFLPLLITMTIGAMMLAHVHKATPKPKRSKKATIIGASILIAFLFAIVCSVALLLTGHEIAGAIILLITIFTWIGLDIYLNWIHRGAGFQ